MSAIETQSIPSSPRSLSDEQSSGDSGCPPDYKILYENEAKKRRELTKLAQKATRDYDELKFRYREVNEMVQILQTKLTDTENKLWNLQNVSEAVYHEYGDLQTRYEVEHDTMSKAFSKATEWYKENKCLRRETAALRRQSAMFLQKFSEDEMELQFDLAKMSRMPDENTEENTEEDNEEGYIEELLQKVKDLEAEVANLSADLYKSTEDDFEAQEEIISLRRKLEESESKLAELKVASEKHVTLSRQSAIMFSEFPSEDLYQRAMQDIEDLRAQLRQEKENNTLHKQTTKNNDLEYQNEFSRNEHEQLKQQCTLLEEEVQRYRSVESKLKGRCIDLQKELEKLQEDSKEMTTPLVNGDISGGHQTNARIPIPPPLPPQAKQAQSKRPPPPRVQSSEGDTKVLIPAPPPPPPVIPPPPPPPPPVMRPSAHKVLGNIIGVSKRKLPEAEIPKAPAMDDLIDQIKRGGIQLKKTPRNGFTRRIRPVEPASIAESGDSPINEMKNILVSMTKIRSNKPNVVENGGTPDNFSNPQVISESNHHCQSLHLLKNENSIDNASPVLLRKSKPPQYLPGNEIMQKTTSTSKPKWPPPPLTKNFDKKHVYSPVPTYNIKNEILRREMPKENVLLTHKQPGKVVSSTTIFLCNPNGDDRSQKN